MKVVKKTDVDLNITTHDTVAGAERGGGGGRIAPLGLRAATLPRLDCSRSRSADAESRDRPKCTGNFPKGGMCTTVTAKRTRDPVQFSASQSRGVSTECPVSQLTVQYHADKSKQKSVR
jgi:hypothetical protein